MKNSPAGIVRSFIPIVLVMIFGGSSGTFGSGFGRSAGLTVAGGSGGVASVFGGGIPGGTPSLGGTGIWTSVTFAAPFWRGFSSLDGSREALRNNQKR